jgi:proton-translocating NADH-quinone oxidoreductase chain L
MINIFNLYIYEMAICVVFYPFFYSLFILIFSSYIKKSFVEIVVFLSLGFSFFFSFFITYTLNYSTFLPETYLVFDLSYYVNWVWLDIGNMPVKLSFFFDRVTSLLLTVIIFVAWMVHIFSFGYMREDPKYSKFLALLLLFTFFMLFFVVSDNIVQVFVGWEGVGLCSYLLINFWYQRVQANKAAIKAFVVNKIGDFSFYFALILIFLAFNTFYLSDLYFMNFLIKKNVFSLFSLGSTAEIIEILRNFPSLPASDFDYIFYISLALTIAAMAKSAQFGLHTWLPDAMEGPTPVSALIHSATMVCAGVILLVRFSPIISFSPDVLTFIVVIGSLTAFFGATVASSQFDIKKIIAYSTCSQIGYMFLACGLTYYGLSLFHLTTHAFFKSLLFLSSGVLIHSLVDEQDMRRSLHSISTLPRNFVIFSIGLLALAGLPFFSGVSKEFIIFATLSTALVDTTSWLLTISFFLSVFAALYTSIYCLNILEYMLPDVYDSFYRVETCSSEYFKFSNNLKDLKVTHFLLIPISILSFLTIFSASVLTDFFIYLNNSFFSSSSSYYEINIPNSFRFFLLLLNVFVIFFFIGSENSFLRQKWNYDYFMSVFARKNISFGFNFVYKNIEKGWLEFLGPKGIWNCLSSISVFLNSLYVRSISSYVFIFLIFFYLFIGFFLLFWF